MHRKFSSSNLKGVLYGKELAVALQKNITKIVRDFKAKHKGHPEIQPMITEKKPAKRGRRDTTKLIGEEIVSFAFPSNFDTSKFKNIDNLLSSLEDWKLEYRKRATGVCDPYFIPAASTSTNPTKFKSITEVVNYLLPKEYTKLPSRNRKRKNIEAKVEEKNVEERDADIPPIGVPITKKRKKIKNKVEKKCSKKRKTNICCGSFSLARFLQDKENTPKEGNVSTETLPILPALQTPSPPRISEVQHGVPPDDGGLENINIENKVEEEFETLPSLPALQTPSPPKISEVQHGVPPDDGGLENINIENMVEEEFETLPSLPALQTPSPPRISEVQHGVPPDDGGLENINIENKVEEEFETLPSLPALQTPSPPRISEVQHGVPPDDGGLENINIENKVEEEFETLPSLLALQTPSPPRISEVQHGIPPDDGGLENIIIENKVEEEFETLSNLPALQTPSPPRILGMQNGVPSYDGGLENMVEEESNKIKTCPGSSSFPQVENNPEEGDVSMETLQNESSSSILEMLAFVPLNYGVDDICKQNEPAFPLNEGGNEDTFNDYFDNQLILQVENNTLEEIAEEDFHECDDWINC